MILPSVARAVRTIASQCPKADGRDGQQRVCAVQRRGYYSGEEIRRCELAGMNPLVPKPLTSGGGRRAEGHFDKRDFVYNAKRDEYRCPAGERAIWRFSTVEAGLTIHKYWSSACPRCPMRAQCTPAPCRRITRWEHESVLEAMQRRLDTPSGMVWEPR